VETESMNVPVSGSRGSDRHHRARQPKSRTRARARDKCRLWAAQDEGEEDLVDDFLQDAR
jgi:hypothetical protein